MSSSGSACGVAPHHPADPGVDQAVLVAGGADRGHPRQPEVPLEVGVEEGRDHRPRGAVDVHRHVDAGAPLQLVEQPAGLGHRLVAAVVGRAHDHDQADGVLVAERDRLLGREVVAVALHGHEAGFDLPVVHELVPADLGVHAHHHVGAVGGQARRPPPLLPAALEGEAAQHAGLARSRGRAADRLRRRPARATAAPACSRSAAPVRPSAGTRPCRSCSCRTSRP